MVRYFYSWTPLVFVVGAAVLATSPYLALVALMIVTLGTERIYVTKQARFTGGFRVVVNPHMVIKAEYLHNEEYGGITEFDNDVATSSLVLAF